MAFDLIISLVEEFLIQVADNVHPRNFILNSRCIVYHTVGDYSLINYRVAPWQRIRLLMAEMDASIAVE